MSIGRPFSPLVVPSFVEFKRDAALGLTAALCCVTLDDLRLMYEMKVAGASVEQFEEIVAIACCTPNGGVTPNNIPIPPLPNPPGVPTAPGLDCIQRMAALACNTEVQTFLRQLKIMIDAAEASPISAFAATDKLILRGLSAAITALLDACARPGGAGEVERALALMCTAVRTMGQRLGSSLDPNTRATLQSIGNVLTFGSPLTAIMKECCQWTT